MDNAFRCVGRDRHGRRIVEPATWFGHYKAMFDAAQAAFTEPTALVWNGTTATYFPGMTWTEWCTSWSMRREVYQADPHTDWRSEVVCPDCVARPE